MSPSDIGKLTPYQLKELYLTKFDKKRDHKDAEDFEKEMDLHIKTLNTENLSPEELTKKTSDLALLKLVSKDS